MHRSGIKAEMEYETNDKWSSKKLCKEDHKCLKYDFDEYFLVIFRRGWQECGRGLSDYGAESQIDNSQSFEILFI